MPNEFLMASEDAARAGAAELLRWRDRFSAKEKGPSDLVTQADLASQEAIRKLLLGRFPEHRFLGEEDGSLFDYTQGYCWVVDPLDGTTNYVHRIPHYAVSIALLKEGRPIVATVLDPVNQECFTACAGSGAMLNGVRISTSPIQRLPEAVVAASFSARIDPKSPEIAQFIQMLFGSQGVRRTGSAALNMCYVACGRFDAFWAMSTKAWDVAGGQLLVEEAGGVVTHYTGKPFDLRCPHPAASSSSPLHHQFLALLNGVPGVEDWDNKPCAATG
jgi:myo-inositol-1(or 4)-monophosphatase